MDPVELERHRREWDAIVFAMNRRMKPSRVRAIYGKRWMIEINFKIQRSQLDDDMTDEESDCTVQASRLVDHTASIMALRMRNRFEDERLPEKLDRDKVYSSLLRLKMTREHGKGWSWCA